MPITHLKYALCDEYIHHWLVTGPLSVTNCPTTPGGDLEQLLLQRFPTSESGVSIPPVDLGALGEITQADPLAVWRYYRCREDHLVDFTGNFPVRECLVAYCYTKLYSPNEQEVNLTLSASGLADTWLNHQHILRQTALNGQSLQTTSLSTVLMPGENEILVRFASPAAQETMLAMAMRVSGTVGVEIILPTEIEPEYLKWRQDLEIVAEHAYLDRYIFGNLEGDRYNQNEPIPMRFSEQMEFSGELTYRLQSLKGDIFQEGTKIFGAKSIVEMAKAFPLRSGPHHLDLLPTAGLYYEKKLRFERKELFYIVRTPFSIKSPLKYQARVQEALKDASERRNDSLFCEIAKMAIHSWENIDQTIISGSLERINQRWNGSVSDLLGFLGLLERFGKRRSFFKDLKPIILSAIANYRYWKDEPGTDVMDFETETCQILYHTCEILAGQLLPDQAFTNSGKTGQWHQQHGEQLAVQWMRDRGMFGFKEWDSPIGMTATSAALTHLVDLAKSDLVSELASVLLDKIFFSLAVNSFKGAYSSSRGSSDTASVFSARLESTSGISRLLWGLGNYNDAVMGTVSLACCQKYELPDLIARIAGYRPSVLWSHEQHCQPLNSPDNPAAGFWRVNKVSYRTADYMLSSAQDYYPGQKGSQEHIWQATLGPDALVFSNHPTCMSEEDAHQPNLWRGNGILPRVAQWGDVLFSIYQLPEDDWLGFTHAYFPAAAFDEIHFSENWAFARKGSGYLALTAARGFEFKTEGQTAFRELRSEGKQNTWVCHMGQELLDGSFENFQQKIQAMEIGFGPLSAHLKSLRGDQIEFGWEGPLLVNHETQPLEGFKHILNAYCAVDLPASQIEIVDIAGGIRLKFD